MEAPISSSASEVSDKLQNLTDSPAMDLSGPSDLAVVERQSRKERLSSFFTILCSGFALISDGLQNNIMTMTNVVFGQLYGSKLYTSTYSTQVSNSLTVGTIFGQLLIGLLCDYKGRKWGIVSSTTCIVVGVILATASHGASGSFTGFIWMLTVARGLTGIGVGGEYPSSSASAAEAANEKALKSRGPIFIMVTNFVLSFGGVFACSLYLIVFEAAGGLDANLSTVWRTVFGISVVPPLAIFVFRLRMLNSKLYRQGAIQKRVPYPLVIRYYWKSLIGTAGAWFLYDFITFPNGVFSGTIIANIIKATGKEKIRKTAEYQLLLSSIALPGCIVGALLVNRLGRRNLTRLAQQLKFSPTQVILGFSGYLVIGLVVGCAYPQLSEPSRVGGFIVLYGLMQSFGNLGPGNVLGLSSAESYATAIIAACCGLAGMLVTYFFIRNDLGSDLAEEDARFAAYLQSKGWSGQIGADNKEGLEYIEDPQDLDEKIAH
ncbi:SPOSA6832_03435, partial [Sporobolomyces salmonicolor]